MELKTLVGKRLRIQLSPSQIDAFETYQRTLIERSWGHVERPASGVAGLTSFRDRERIERRHIGESLVLLEVLERHGAFGSPMIDVGSGGGFPGVPIRIIKPNLEVTLLEANGRKAAFLGELVRKLGLSGVTVVNDRAESAAHDLIHRETYEVAVARAVAPLRVLVELALPFVRIGGYLATPKGSGAHREVREAETALNTLGGEVLLVEKLELDWPGPTPTLVLVRKVSETPVRYPRRPGLPAKRPL
jgi:16S rRNA (guanine527-N7)-methyltransferase